MTLELEAVKAAPPVGVATWIWLGHTPAEWVSALTVAYLLMMMLNLLIPGGIAGQVRTFCNWLKSFN